MVASAPQFERLLVTIPEACRLLSVGRTHLYKLHRYGYFDFVHLGRSARVRYADLARLAEVAL